MLQTAAFAISTSYICSPYHYGLCYPRLARPRRPQSLRAGDGLAAPRADGPSTRAAMTSSNSFRSRICQLWYGSRSTGRHSATFASHAKPRRKRGREGEGREVEVSYLDVSYVDVSNLKVLCNVTISVFLVLLFTILWYANCNMTPSHFY